ncbi:hypothetical protein [Haloarchaeobius sp. HME9146]|uniref:hypothetical protein n=1 Tax=Haloarchaeobius sp. HME9146 TaxID=2978732 RepID=UPI0021BE81A1|nr:hypothetical protein [Haloarchaeobius sp. HME9146]MCT9097911.1 hypothetical protein [Haloarchaeobius sp. HME9146]
MTPTDHSETEPSAYSRRTVLAGVAALGATLLAAPVARAAPISQLGESPTEAEEEPAEYTSYQTVTDDTGIISVQVPSEWTEAVTIGSPDTELNLLLSPELDTFATSFESAESKIVTPGAVVVYMPTTTGDPAELSQQTEGFPVNCQKSGESIEYANQNGLEGVVTIHGNCGGSDDLVIKFIAEPANAEGMVAAAIAVTDDRDIAAAVAFLETLAITTEMTEPESEPESPLGGLL